MSLLKTSLSESCVKRSNDSELVEGLQVVMVVLPLEEVVLTMQLCNRR